MRRVLAVLVVLVLCIVGIMIGRTLAVPSARLPVPEPAPLTLDGNAIAGRLAEALRIPTLSLVPGRAGASEESFRAFRAWLAETYPAFHAATTLETVGTHTLIFKWEGSGSDQAPVAFLAHQDVVPVEPDTLADWTHPPFDGVIADGYVWGRGALDMKSILVTVVEAAERLAQEDFRPTRDIYFFFGHDEEVGGEDGMAAVKALMLSRGIRLAWTLDEGSSIIEGRSFLGVEPDVALISTAEKGYLTLALTAQDPGGHSSVPRNDTAISRLGRALARLSERQFPARIDAQTEQFLRAVASEQDFLTRFLVANLWLTAPLVESQLLANPTTAARLRTTTAATMIEGGTAENVLPQNATATVNFRIHPSDTIESVIARVERVIADEAITVRVAGISPPGEPSPSGAVDGEGYRIIEGAVGSVFGPIVAAPSLTVAGTDSKHMVAIADDTYRFAPFRLTPEDLAGIHGTNEHIPVAQLPRMVAFYETVLRHAGD